MAFVNFIDFYSTLDEAVSVRTSPQIDFYECRGIQLLPNNTYPYRQTTNLSTGVELEDWTAYIVDYCTGVETDVTAFFSVDRIFNDDNGIAQIDWSLTNVTTDFGNGLVYLKVSQLIGDTFYSNLFQLTATGETTRLDYKNASSDTMQSIELKMWFWQPLKNQEITTYYETSTRNTVTNVIKSQKYERWITDWISTDLIIKISEVFENKFAYVDLTRAFLFEAIEVEEHDAMQNFEENIIKIAFNTSDTFNPLAVTASTPNIPAITLSSVVANGVNAIYTFSYANFTPTYLVFEYSADQVTWTSNTKGVTSTQSIPFNGTGVWYFRISHPEAISNVITLDLGNSVVAVNDSAQVEKGGTIDINVLFNDTLVGTTTITAVTTPTNGTATIIDSGTKVRYVHNDSVTTADIFDYTISNGITSDSATVSMTITQAGGTVKSFLTNTNGHSSRLQAASLPLDVTRYFVGDLSFPEINDVIYQNDSGTTIFNGGNKWYPVPTGRVIKINSSGIVIDASIS